MTIDFVVEDRIESEKREMTPRRGYPPQFTTWNEGLLTFKISKGEEQVFIDGDDEHLC